MNVSSLSPAAGDHPSILNSSGSPNILMQGSVVRPDSHADIAISSDACLTCSSQRDLGFRSTASERANVKPKVFCIGCHKAGTTTLHAFALAHGYKSLHSVTWSRPDPSQLQNHDFFSDGGGHFWLDRCDEDESFWGNFHNLTYLYSYYPSGRFVLQTRPLKPWLIRKCMQAGWTDDAAIAPDDPAMIVHDNWDYRSRLTIREWIRARNRYHAKTLAFFEKRDRDRLCVIDVCTDTRSATATLQSFLGLPDGVSLGHANAARVGQSRALASRIVSEILAEQGEAPDRLI